MNNEMLTVLSYLEREKGISRATLIKAVEGALQSAARKSSGTSQDIRVSMDPRTCEITTYQDLVVSEDQTGTGYISLEKAREINPDSNLGDIVSIEVTPKDFGRIAAQAAKQALMQNIRNAERDVVYERYLSQVGKIISATVKQVPRGDCICEVDGGGEAILSSKNKLPTDRFEQTDQFRAYLLRVENEENQSTPGIVLSRTAPEFVKALFVEQVTEIKDGIIEVMGIARDAGYRTKMAVRSLDPKIDSIGACVGVRGSRIKPVIQELNGEKIDIVEWNEDIRVFAMNALAPAKIESVKVDRDDDGKNVVVGTVLPEHYTQTIGKNGQNVRLTAALLGWRVKVVKLEGPKSFAQLVTDGINSLALQLHLPIDVAEVIYNAGFHTPEGVKNASLESFTEDTQLDAEAAEQAWNAATAYLDLNTAGTGTGVEESIE
ncbi:MAG: transcription termination factor NusA [Lentisphaerae bacterium]|jgi:N utilization substance protein A|nr:transcription termination factor NusA [Lentisphaerota bacterium]